MRTLHHSALMLFCCCYCVGYQWVSLKTMCNVLNAVNLVIHSYTIWGPRCGHLVACYMWITMYLIRSSKRVGNGRTNAKRRKKARPFRISSSIWALLKIRSNLNNTFLDVLDCSNTYEKFNDFTVTFLLSHISEDIKSLNHHYQKCTVSAIMPICIPIMYSAPRLAVPFFLCQCTESFVCKLYNCIIFS